VGVLAHDLLDLFLVFLGGLLDAGAHHFEAGLLQGRHHRPALHAAGDQEHLLAFQARTVGRDAVPGALLFDGDQGLGAIQQIRRGAPLHQQPGQLAQGVAHVLDAVERALEEGMP
jgi:hypothetical protein